MENLGEPFSIQNTTGADWLVTWRDAVTLRATGESVSFTVAIPRNAELSISEVQRYAMKRAVEILQRVIAAGN